MAGRELIALLVLAAVGCGLCARAAAEPYGQFYRPQDDWRVIETAHFRIYSTQDTRRSAAYVRRLAEPTFARLNRFYDYHPTRKIRVILVGYTTFSNGFAEADHDRITLFASPPDFHSRSRVPWLDNVFTHELAHILSLNTASHWWQRVPLILGTGVVRSAQSQTLVRVPLYGRNFPHWFAEGVAQFDTSLLGRDGFDENRAAFQRALFEDGLLFPLDKLAFFGGEQWYNTGLSFLTFLELRFGSGTVHGLFKAAGQAYDYDFDQLFPRALGVRLQDLERDYRAEVAQRFGAHLARVHGGEFDGTALRFEQVTPDYRELTPEQRDLLRDEYAGMPLRYLDGTLFFRRAGAISYATLESSEFSLHDVKQLSSGSAVAPHAPGSYFVLKPVRDQKNPLPTWFRQDFESNSLFVIDRAGHEKKLLSESRLSELDSCAARSEIAGAYDDGDGSVKLALYKVRGFGTPDVEVDSASLRFPLPEQAFDEVRGPRYSPDCSRIYFSRRVGRDHDLFAYVLDTGEIETISAEPAFELYPDPTPDGVYYVSSRDGNMNVYLRRNGARESVLVTEAVTGHHHPIATPDALVFARMYASSFRMHAQRYQHALPPAVDMTPLVKGEVQSIRLASLRTPADAPSYHPLALDNWVAPTLVPLLDFEYDPARTLTGALRFQAGLELYLQDELSRHSLLLRGYAGDEASFLFDYDNSMLPVSVRVRGGLYDIRGLWVYANGGAHYEQNTDDRWGFLWGSLRLPLNLFYTASLTAETIRDLGIVTGARSRHFDFGAPAYSRELFGGVLSYDGIDRRDPTFRERDINKRGYRQFTLAAYYGVENVSAILAQQDRTIHGGATPFFRAEGNYSEYLALPALARGWYDHSLQLDLTLGYISQDLTYFPFFGGGRLYSQAAPVYNASVGFAGYTFGNLRGETLANLGVAYRGPLLRNLGWSVGPIYLQDVYFQLFTSWGNIWGWKRNGERQIPFYNRAPNGNYVLGDVGLDIRLGHFIQSVEANVGTTLRAVYRLVPFSQCPDGSGSSAASCLGPDGERALTLYFIVGGGF
jgi:hypothetical protein